MAADKSPSTPTYELTSEAYKGDNDIFVQTDASEKEAIKTLVAKAMPRQYVEEVVTVRALRLTRTQ